MFNLSIKIMPIFNIPQKIDITSLIDFYIKQLKINTIKEIDTPIKNSLFEMNNKDFEIDIVLELKRKEIINFIDKFINRICFKDYYIKNEKDKSNEEKITCFMEISRNLISQGKEELEQIKKYIKIIKIMNIMRNLVVTDIDEYQKILSKYKCSKETEKVFSIITDGNYNELNFVLNKIVIPQLNYLEGKELEEKDIEDIKDFIRNKINDKKELFDNSINKENFIDNIYNIFEVFYHLKTNKIQFCLIYIGEICESTSNLTNILNHIKEQGCFNENGNNLNDYIDKKKDSLLNLKNKYYEIKSTIDEFEKECENNIVFTEESIDKIINEIDFNIFDFDNFISKHKFQCNAFIFFKEAINSENIIISNLKKFFQFKKEYLDINKEKMKKEIFDIAKKDKDTPYFLIFEKTIPQLLLSLICDYNENIFIFLLNNEEGENAICFNPDKLINKINIETSFRNIINQEINNYQSSYLEDQRLMPSNLGNKLINDLKIIFKLKRPLNIESITNKIIFDIPEENEKKLFKYFDNLSDKLRIKNMNYYPEIKTNFTANLAELKKNILPRHFYNIFFHKIGNHFSNKVKEELLNNISKNYKII